MAMNVNKINRISKNLQGTTENLKSLDQMLEMYKDAGRDQKTAIDKLRTDLDKTKEDLKHERKRKSRLLASGRGSGHEGTQSYPKSSMRGYDSDADSSPPHRHKKRIGSVHFADDMNEDLHSLHQSVRDISLDQSKLGNRFSRELHHRDLSDNELRNKLRDISEGLKSSRIEPAEVRLERRLQSIHDDIKTDRRLIDQRYDEVGAISADLKHALQQQQHLLHQPNVPAQTVIQLDDYKYQKQALQTEALKNKVENELDDIKRKLNQSEGGRLALMSQIEDLKNRLAKCDDEKRQMKRKIDDSYSDEIYRDRRKKLSAEEERERDYNRFRSELQELRSQLTRGSNSATFSDDLRREIDKNDRHRAQLSDHIEVLTKNLDEKERQHTKILWELKEMTNKCDDVERQRVQLGMQLEDAVGRLKLAGEENERLSNQVNFSQNSLQDLERRRDELKSRAHETVQQWKVKCKKLQQDVDELAKQLKNECRKTEQQDQDAFYYREELKQNHLLLDKERSSSNNKQGKINKLEEDLNKKNKELEELKSSRVEVDAELRTSKLNADKLKHDLENLSTKETVLSREKNELQDAMKSLQSRLIDEQNEKVSLQMEIKDLNRIERNKDEQLLVLTSKNEDLAKQLNDAISSIESLESNLSDVQRKQNEEQELHGAAVLEMNSKLERLNISHQREVDELNERMDKDIGDYEKDIEMLRAELVKEQTGFSHLRQTQENLMKELQRLHDQIQIYEEDRVALDNKCKNLEQESERRTKSSLQDIERIETAERYVQELREEMTYMETNNKTNIEKVAAIVDQVLESAIEGSLTSYKELAVSGDAPYHVNLLFSIENKLKWLKDEIENVKRREKNLHHDLLETLNVNEKDKNILMTEMAKKDEKLDQLILLKDEITYKDEDNIDTDVVVKLNNKLKDISEQLQFQKLREEQRIKDLIEYDKKVDEIDESNIEKRYSKLRDTIKLLQKDLNDSRISSRESK